MKTLIFFIISFDDTSIVQVEFWIIFAMIKKEHQEICIFANYNGVFTFRLMGTQLGNIWDK